MDGLKAVQDMITLMGCRYGDMLGLTTLEFRIHSVGNILFQTRLGVMTGFIISKEF